MPSDFGITTVGSAKARRDFLYPSVEMTLMNFLYGIGDSLGSRTPGRLQHSILDVSAAYFVVMR
jgi:hypothetical protein